MYHGKIARSAMKIVIFVSDFRPIFPIIAWTHSQPFIASNRPKQGIKLGLKLLILATCDPNGDQMKVAFHQ